MAINDYCSVGSVVFTAFCGRIVDTKQNPSTNAPKENHADNKKGEAFAEVSRLRHEWLGSDAVFSAAGFGVTFYVFNNFFAHITPGYMLYAKTGA